MPRRLAIFLDAFLFLFRCDMATRGRSAIYRRYLLSSCGNGLKIKYGAIIDAPEFVKLGHNVGVGEYCFITGNGGICIGDNVMIGHHVSILTSSHVNESVEDSMKGQGIQLRPVIIGDDVWLGAGARIMMGVSIGRGVIVGANAVVTTDIPDWAVVGGVPARIIRSRQAPSGQTA